MVGMPLGAYTCGARCIGGRAGQTHPQPTRTGQQVCPDLGRGVPITRPESLGRTPSPDLHTAPIIRTFLDNLDRPDRIYAGAAVGAHGYAGLSVSCTLRAALGDVFPLGAG